MWRCLGRSSSASNCEITIINKYIQSSGIHHNKYLSLQWSRNIYITSQQKLCRKRYGLKLSVFSQPFPSLQRDSFVPVCTGKNTHCVSEWADSSRHISTNRLYSAIHIGIRWKIWTEDKSKTNVTKTKHNPEKANNTKHSKTKLPLFSRLLQHSARKRGGYILQCYRAHVGRHTHCTRPN